jgi:hypothetical protein
VGNDSKVIIDNIQYNIDSIKLSNAISDLEAVLGNLHSEGDVNDYTEVIIPSTTVPFQEEDDTGIYAFETPSTFNFNEGEKYLVTFDGVSYEVTIKKFSFTLTFDEGNGAYTETVEFLYAGNGDIIKPFFVNLQVPITGLESSSEPFALLQRNEEMGVLTTSTDATHTIAIYKAADSNGDNTPSIAWGQKYTSVEYNSYVFYEDGSMEAYA